MGKQPTPAMDKLDAAGEEEILGRIANGEEVEPLLADYGVSRQSLHNWFNANPERQRRYREARRISAEVAVERAWEELEGAREETSAAKVKSAKNRSDYQRWLASVRDREQFADNPQIQINNNLNVGDLHLDALRQFGSMGPAVVSAEEPKVLEGEVEEEGTGLAAGERVENLGHLPQRGPQRGEVN